MATLYSNLKGGLTTDAPLTSGATTINSAAFANLPTVAGSDTMWITLDPAGVDGAPEIVSVTAHTAAATAVTVVRAQQSTVARSHPVSSVWAHSLTKTDIDALAAASAATAWTAVTYVNSWANVPGNQGAQYRKRDDDVTVRGLTRSGSSGTVAFTLPVGFRPPANNSFTQLGGTGVVTNQNAQVATNGEVTISYSGGLTFSVNFTFSTTA